jgi:hypothetical protein
MVCDSSSLIALSENCLLWLLPEFKGAEFIIPTGVKYELVDRPIETFRFELKALNLNLAIKNGWLKPMDAPGVKQEADEIARLANSVLISKGRPLKIVHQGEAESLALMDKLGVRTLLIDERTTRLVVEDVNAVRDYMAHRTGLKLSMDGAAAQSISQRFKDVSVVRSAELVAWAFEKGLLSRFGSGKHVLEAALYGVKFSGCAITTEEIDEYLKMLSR